MKECKTCLLHEGIKGVKIFDDGNCNYCHWDETMNMKYPINNDFFIKQVDWIKEQGRGCRYDVVVGLSGGCDSSILLKRMVERGVRCLGVHWDNNWNTGVAWDNMVALTDNLGVDFRVRHIDRYAYDSLCKSFLLASVPDADIPNDIALASVLYEEAESENIPVIINGHSFRTEGTCPNGWTYMDGKYIQSVNDSFLKTDLTRFPNMTLRKWLRWMPIRRVRPLYYLDYRKSDAKKELVSVGWMDYGGHHNENYYTSFVGRYLWPNKFGQDLRFVALSAQIRNGHISKDDAKKVLKEPMVYDFANLDLIKKRLGFTDDEFMRMMQFPVKSHVDYETYDFHRLREIFLEFQDVLPQTFIDKYVNKIV